MGYEHQDISVASCLSTTHLTIAFRYFHESGLIFDGLSLVALCLPRWCQVLTVWSIFQTRIYSYRKLWRVLTNLTQCVTYASSERISWCTNTVRWHTGIWSNIFQEAGTRDIDIWLPRDAGHIEQIQRGDWVSFTLAPLRIDNTVLGLWRSIGCLMHFTTSVNWRAATIS